MKLQDLDFRIKDSKCAKLNERNVTHTKKED